MRGPEIGKAREVLKRPAPERPGRPLGFGVELLYLLLPLVVTLAARGNELNHRSDGNHRRFFWV